MAGGVANDKVFNAAERYFNGLIDKTEAISRLRYEKRAFGSASARRRPWQGPV